MHDLCDYCGEPIPGVPVIEVGDGLTHRKWCSDQCRDFSAEEARLREALTAEPVTAREA